MLSIRPLRAAGGIRHCLFSFVILPLSFLMLVVALFDFNYNGLNLEHIQNEQNLFRPFLKSSLNDSETSNLPIEPYRGKVMEVIHLARLISVDKNCRSQNVEKQPHYGFHPNSARFYVEQHHKLLYCYIPKVASTNVKRLLLLLSGFVTKENVTSATRNLIHYKNPMPKLHPRNEKELVQRGFDKHSRFLFVRHPFYRVVSAYYDKFSPNKSWENNNSPIIDKQSVMQNRYYPLEVGTKIIQKYRTNPSNRSLQEGDDVTVSEFVDFIIGEWTAKRELDFHWKPMVDICLPCSIKYDFIGRFETMQQDIDFLLHKLNKDEFGQFFEKTKPYSTSQLVKRFMDQLTPLQLSQLYQVYEQDFKVFGYDPDVNKPISPKFN